MGESGIATNDRRSFYESYVGHHVPYHSNPRALKRFVLAWLPYWSWREWRFWRRWAPRGCRLLDLGCARGREIFRERAALCAGADLAFPALRECADHYDLASQAFLTALPFGSATFDCVVTSHVLGHVPVSEKNAVIAEIARVLKPGGRSLHVIETDSNHPLIAFAKRDPVLYEKYFVRPDGHIGLEHASDVLRRFESCGLRLLRCYKMDAGEFHPRLLLKWFGNEYAERHDEIAAQVREAKRILKSPALLALKEIRLGLHHHTRGQSLPLDNSQFIALVLEKPPLKD
jgi:SAM-dependent methyltransferase